MGKNKKSKKRINSANSQENISINSKFFQKNQDWIYPVLLVLLVVIYFWPITYGGYSAAGNDAIFVADCLSRQWGKLVGRPTFYDLGLFSGTPNYSFFSLLTIPMIMGILKVNFFFQGVSLYLCLGTLGFFYLLSYIGVSRIVSFISSLGFILIPSWCILFLIGHGWKFYTILLIPFCLYFFLRLFDKPSFLNLACYAFFQVWQIQSCHYQIIYYTIMLMGVVTIVKIIEYRKEINHLVRSGILIALALIITAGVTFQPLFLMNEYSKHTIRGAKTEDGRVGLSKSYATSWSFSPKELLTLVIPRAFGGASGEQYDISNPKYPHLSGRDIPGYWGNMPFTQGSDYMGVVLVFLAFIGVVLNWKKRIVKGFAFLAILAVFLSFGRHFSLVYDLFFNFAPGFNKFRAPSMILVLVEIVLAIFAGFGINDILKREKKNLWKVALINFAIFLGLGLFVLAISGQFSFVGPNDRYDAQSMMIIKNIRKEFLFSDLYRYFILLIITFAVIAVYLKNLLKKSVIFLVLITVLLVGDFTQIQDRFLFKKNGSDYAGLQKNNEKGKEILKATSAERFLLNKKPEGEIFSPYRIYPVTSDFWATGKYSTYFQSIGGYSPAKLRIYQDLVDYGIVNGGLSRNITNMLSAKYFITPAVLPNQPPFENLKLEYSDQQYNVYLNEESLPKGWFVGDYKVVKSRNERFAYLKSDDFSVKQTALLEEDLLNQISLPQNARAELELFEPEKIKFKICNDNDGLFVVSSVYYPDGWHAYLDGEEVHIYKTNHVLSSVFVPKGEHELFFHFAPYSIKWTGMVSQSFKILWALLLVFAIVRWYLRRSKTSQKVQVMG